MAERSHIELVKIVVVLEIDGDLQAQRLCWACKERDGPVRVLNHRWIVFQWAHTLQLIKSRISAQPKLRDATRDNAVKGRLLEDRRHISCHAPKVVCAVWGKASGYIQYYGTGVWDIRLQNHLKLFWSCSMVGSGF